MIQQILQKGRKIQKNFHEQLFAIQNKKVIENILKVKNQQISYLDIEALKDLAEVAINNERKRLEGIIIETGCALGGSGIILANSKSKQRKLFIYDVFGMIPSPSERDSQDVHNRYTEIVSGNSSGLGNNLYYGYEADLLSKVIKNFSSFGFELEKDNIHLVKGLYQDTLKINEPVSLAHIDCDWFDSVWVCLESIEPHLVNGGTLVIDDYNAWSGCKTAVDEYFRDKQSDYKFVQKSRLHIIKV